MNKSSIEPYTDLVNQAIAHYEENIDYFNFLDQVEKVSDQR